MIGKLSWFVSLLPLVLGFCFVLYGVGIVLRNDYRRYLRDSELLKIVTGLTATWKTKTKGFIKTVWVTAVCLFAIICFAMVPLQHVVIPAPTIEMHNVEVAETLGDFDYWLISEAGDRIYGKFCDTLGYKPPFDAGEILTTLKFKNRGVCWDMRDMHPKYEMLRNKEGKFINKQGDLVFKEN